MADPDVGGQCIREAKAGGCVIFVHGILSDGERAWTNETTNTSWPQLLAADSKLCELGIYVFSYRSDIFCRNYSVSDVVASMREFFDIEDMWRMQSLTFACHSMGGIATRRFIIANQAKLIDRNPRLGLFLVASPSLGAKDANRVHFLARLVRNSQEEALRFSQENVWLNDIDQDFLALKESDKLSRRMNLHRRRTMPRGSLVHASAFDSSAGGSLNRPP